MLVQAGGDSQPGRRAASECQFVFHSMLAKLTRAGSSPGAAPRSIIYRGLCAMNALVGYLMENCCGRSACTHVS